MKIKPNKRGKIAASAPSGGFLNGLSLFANIGIAEAYFRSVGIDIKVANEFVEKRARLYQAIYPETKMICGDITENAVYLRILEASKEAQVDFVMATPPCQGMSTAGKQKEFDPRNDLFKYAVSLIRELTPKYFLFENVPGFLSTEVLYSRNPSVLPGFDGATPIPDVIRAELGDSYSLSFNLANTDDYQVPQTRKRMILLGTRKDVDHVWTMPPACPKKTTMRDAIGWIPIIDPFVRDISPEEFKKRFPQFENRRKAALAISPWNEPTSHVFRNVEVMQHTPTGKSAFENEIWKPRKKNGVIVRGFKNTYKRQNWETPAYTIAMDNVEISSQNNVHPGRPDGTDDNGEQLFSDPRTLTLYELMKLMSIPDSWPIPPETDSKFLRKVIGEGVPSLFMRKIVENIPALKERRPKLRGLSLFANVGVAEARLKPLGVDIRIANELVPERARFYADVYPDTHMIQGDITDDILRARIIEEAIEKDVNFIIATPPCQGMSRVGKMEELDVRNQLIYYAVDAIKRVVPEYVLIENVTTILHTKIAVNGEIMMIPDYLRKELGALYNFNKKTVVRAMDYSIPQIRHRNIFLLVRKDKNTSWEFPPATPAVTLEQAIGNLPSLDPMLREGLTFTLEKFPDFQEKTKAGAAISKWHRPPVHSWRLVEWMMHTPTGHSATENEVYYPVKTDGKRVSAHYNQYRRLDWGKPSRCLTQNNGVISSLACVHPGHPYQQNGETLYSDPRVFSIYEIMVISSLPLDWPIPDWADENLIRKVIGEGVPSHLIEVIVQALLERI